jgi:proteasome lid subunit RPN8/RPN11
MTEPLRAEGEPLGIPAGILAAMVDHCRREAPLECCGILGGIPPRVDSIHPLRNIEASPSRYNADPADILDALRSLRTRGARFLAIYHSHPAWQAIPSRTDLETNYYGDLPRIIVSLLSDPPEVRSWRLESDSYEELPWRVVEDGPGVAVERPPAPR